MACDLNQLVADGAAFQHLPKWKFNIINVFILALLLKANGGDDLTDLTALGEQMKQYNTLTESDLQAAYIQLLVDSLSGTEIPAPTEDEIAAVFRSGQCLPPDILRKAEICLLDQLLEDRGQ